jgi:hypothetical protein
MPGRRRKVWCITWAASSRLQDRELHQHPFGCGADGQDPDPDQLPPAAEYPQGHCYR